MTQRCEKMESISPPTEGPIDQQRNAETDKKPKQTQENDTAPVASPNPKIVSPTASAICGAEPKETEECTVELQACADHFGVKIDVSDQNISLFAWQRFCGVLIAMPVYVLIWVLAWR